MSWLLHIFFKNYSDSRKLPNCYMRSINKRSIRKQKRNGSNSKWVSYSEIKPTSVRAEKILMQLVLNGNRVYRLSISIHKKG